MKYIYAKVFLAFIAWSYISFIGLAQIPAGYYNNVEGKMGKELKTTLANIIRNHTERSYSELWTDFQKTDCTSDGYVWDMYSSSTHFTFIIDQCGNYRSEGDCYNREHSFPKSWFNDAKPMYTDLFHIYPTDGYVNNRRGNDPFGETDKPTYSSKNGFSKLGPSSFSGYSGTVFEPADEYKGDFARSYFYMVTCYEKNVSSWKSEMLNNTAYPAFSTWAMNLLLKWSREDPVSEKEINRNEAVSKIQKNRNPFIDFKGLEEYIWGTKTDDPFEPTGVSENRINSSILVYASEGKIIISSDSYNIMKIYDIVGRVIRQVTINIGETEIVLPSGMYIVNGKKVVL